MNSHARIPSSAIRSTYFHNFILAAIYFGAAKLGLSLSDLHPSATIFWAPTGIAIAALLFFGKHLYPGVFLGAFLANITTEGTIFTSIAIAFGNTMEGLFAALFTEKYCGGRNVLREPRNIFLFSLLAGCFSSAVSASIGTGALLLGGFLDWQNFAPVWITWWLGDAGGALIIAPFLIAWLPSFSLAGNRLRKTLGRLRGMRKRDLAERVLMLVCVVLTARIVFGGMLRPFGENLSLSFLAMAVLFWPAIRFGTKETALATLLLDISAAYAIFAMAGSSALEEFKMSAFIILQIFCVFSSVAALIIAALVERTKEAEMRLRESNADITAKEEYSRMLAESMPQIVWSADKFGNFNYANALFQEYIGSSHTLKWSEREWERVIHSNDYPLEKKMWEDSLLNGRGHEMEYRLRRKDGEYRWHFARIVPVKNEARDAVYWVGTVVDIDDHKRARDREQFLSETSKILMSDIEYESRMRKVTRLAVPYLGDWCAVHIRREETGKIAGIAAGHKESAYEEDLLEYLARYPIDPDSSAHPIALAIKTGEPVLVPQLSPEFFREIAQSEEERSVLEKFAFTSGMSIPIFSKGKTVGAFSVASSEKGHEYTKRDLAFAEEFAARIGIALEQTRLFEKIKEEDRRKSAFLAILSHELRNPLAAIMLSLDLLAMREKEAAEARNDESKPLLETCRDQFARLTRIVDDLLHVSRIMYGKFELSLEETDLSNIMRKAAATAKPLLDERGHEFIISLPDTPLMLLLDPIRLEQALVNILQNAAKYTPPGGTVSFVSRIEEGSILITVRDTGIGIEPSMLSFIFEPFAQGPQHELKGKESAGLGIGLMLAKSVIESHGGTIAALSGGKGTGSEFVIRIPLSE